MHIINHGESGGIVALDGADTIQAREVLSDLLLPG
jgi:hypothetical protein